MSSVRPEAQGDAAIADRSIFVDRSVDASAPLASVAAWTDPPMLSVLREDCAFDPYKTSPEQSLALFGSQYVNPALLCNGGEFDQSCVYDPCFSGASWDCKTKCLGTCRDCDADCMGTCVSCKAQCADEPCRETCVSSSAKCRQECLTTQDRCRTGRCTELYETCMTKLVHDWHANHCEAQCTSFIPCRDKCMDRALSGEPLDQTACVNGCKAGLNASCDFGLCGGKYGMGIEIHER